VKLVRTVTYRLLVTLLLLATPAAAGGSTVGNPWQLRCPSMPEEQPAPAPLQAVALRFFPWIHPAAETLQAGPVYLVALSSDTAIARDGDALDSAGFYLHRALIAVAPSYHGAVTIHGHRVGSPGPRTTLEFSRNGASACTVKSPDVICPPRQLAFARSLRIPPSAGWRIAQTEIRIGRTGCFELTATGPHLHAVVPLAVPGPDYGTPGW
jgi:hypothetical protein